MNQIFIMLMMFNIFKSDPDRAWKYAKDIEQAAIKAEISDPNLIPLFISVGWHESRYREGTCHSFTNGAYGCWQNHFLEDGATILEQAISGIKKLERAGNYCAARGFERYRGAVSLYATGGSCNWIEVDKTDSDDRMRTFKHLLGRRK